MPRNKTGRQATFCGSLLWPFNIAIHPPPPPQYGKNTLPLVKKIQHKNDNYAQASPNFLDTNIQHSSYLLFNSIFLYV